MPIKTVHNPKSRQQVNVTLFYINQQLLQQLHCNLLHQKNLTRSKRSRSKIYQNYLAIIVLTVFTNWKHTCSLIEKILTCKYKNWRCGMIVHETAIHQMTVKSKLLQVPLATMNQSPHHNGSFKRPQNAKLYS